MAEPHVLTGAIANRAEIAGQIKHTQDKFRQLAIDLDIRPLFSAPELRPPIVPIAGSFALKLG